MPKHFIFLVLITALLAGCATTRDIADSKTALLEPGVMQKFSDVPVPSRFKFLPENSYTFESGGIRVGVLKYHGKASPDAVVEFYKEQMPMYSWRLLNVVEYGNRLLNFDRDHETCIISILSKGNSVDIIASIGPKAAKSTVKSTKKILDK